MTSVDRKMLKTFAEESAARLEQITDDLEQLADAPDPEELVASLFRETHNLKGAANLVGVRAVELLAHALENILEPLRSGGRSPDSQLVAILEAGYQRIDDLLQNPQVLAFVDVRRDVATLERHLAAWLGE